MTDLDTTLTTALNRRALAVNPAAPPVTAIAERAQRHTRRKTTRTAAAAVGGLALVAGVVAIPTIADRQPDPAPAASEPTNGSRTPNATVPGWTLTNTIQRSDYAEFQFHEGDRQLQLSYYPGDFVTERLNTKSGAPSTPVQLRGTTGFVPHGFPMPDQTYLPGEMDGVAPGLSRIVWLEGGWTIEASGTGIPTSQDLTDVLETLQPYTP